MYWFDIIMVNLSIFLPTEPVLKKVNWHFFTLFVSDEKQEVSRENVLAMQWMETRFSRSRITRFYLQAK